MKKVRCNCRKSPCVCPQYEEDMIDWNDPTLDELFWKVREGVNEDSDAFEALDELREYVEELEDIVFALQTELIKFDNDDIERLTLITSNEVH